MYAYVLVVISLDFLFYVLWSYDFGSTTCWTCVLGIYMIIVFLILTSSLENNETSDYVIDLRL